MPPAGRLSYVVLPLLSVVGTLFALEIFLRLVPIPNIFYRTFYYDPITGGKYYPHTTVIFWRDDGVAIRRRTNAWGFSDVEHRLATQPGTLRIGFFGDSYTEAAQMPIEATFFRLIENDLNARRDELGGLTNRRGEPVQRIEVLSFGIAGRGTLPSYLECTIWMAACDLDYVVYVFAENDPADQIERLKHSDNEPYPILAGDSFVIDSSFNQRYGYKASWWHRAFQRIKSSSLVVSTVERQLKNLSGGGTTPKADGAGRAVTRRDPRETLAVPPAAVVERSRRAEMAALALGGTLTPMAPSTWPPELVAPGWTLVERVLDRWKGQVDAEGRKFAIACIPHEGQVTVPLSEQDTWAPRLHEYCARRGIPLIDPTTYLLAHLRAGEAVFDNHLSRVGHRAFADAFVSDFIANASRTN